jgi:folate-binding protein YgfZ
MELTPEVQRELDAVRAGQAFAPLDSRVFEVVGPDARKWLNDLVTAGVGPLEPGESAESLLLDATGRIKCHFVVGCIGDESFILVQQAEQPESVGRLLSRYVLTSRVALTDVSGHRSVVRLTGGSGGPAGTWMVGDSVSPIAVHTASDGFEASRVADGIPKLPNDFAETSVPAEAGWDDTMVDAQKGCFLGQESVAKIRNRGRPPFLVVGLRANVPVEVGEPVLLEGSETGVVTSALSGAQGSALIARVRWFDGDTPDLRASSGAALTRPA